MNKKLKTFITVFFIGAAYAVIYALPFVQYMFYDPLVESIGATNAQLGTLIAIYGLGNIFGAPVGGWLADKINSGTKVTFISLIGLCASTALIAVGVDMHNFPFFFAMSVLTFVCCGFATGATFRMIPHVFGNPLLSSLITGFVAAVAAYGAFITPKIFGFVYSMFGNIHPAFAVLLAFNIVTVAVCYWFYVRKGANMNV